MTTKSGNAAKAAAKATAATVEEEEEAETSPAAEMEMEEETESEDTSSSDDSDEIIVDETLFAEQPILDAGTYEMEIIRCQARVATSDEREGFRSGIEYTLEPDREEYPDVPPVKFTVWAHFYDDDKAGFKNMNRAIAQAARKAGLFPPEGQVRLRQKKVVFDYENPIGMRLNVKVKVETFAGEKQNRVVIFEEA